MTNEELFQRHGEVCKTALELMKKKNADYAGSGGGNPFVNFTRVEDMGICKTEQGFLVRLTDKMSRLSSFVQNGKLQVTDESFNDTCIDVIIYIILMQAYVSQKDKS